jgi:hypothetical protein
VQFCIDNSNKKIVKYVILCFFVGFSADQFSQNDDPNVGNKVFLVSESDAEYSCAVHKDGCTETQIMCYTPKYVLFPSKYGNS